MTIRRSASLKKFGKEYEMKKFRIYLLSVILFIPLLNFKGIAQQTIPPPPFTSPAEVYSGVSSPGSPVKGDGSGGWRSEKLLAQLKRDREVEIIIATKAGRRLNPHVASGYTGENITAFIERSLKNLETDSLDLVQLHCPPTEVYYFPELFGALDDLVKQGKIKNYGVSVEKVEEAIKAIEYENVKTVQFIFNIFRQRPANLFLDLAKQKRVGILARLPLSSGMLIGNLQEII